jgi:hypothetical protein
MKRVAAAGVGLLFLTGAAPAGDAEGIWLSQDGDIKVRLSNCGAKLSSG